MTILVKAIDPETAARALQVIGSVLVPVLSALPLSFPTAEVYPLDWEAFTQVQRDALIRHFMGKYPDLADEIDERGWNGGLYIEANKVELVDEAANGEKA